MFFLKDNKNPIFNEGLLAFVGLLTTFLLFSSSSSFSQCLTDYNFYKQITIQNSKVPSDQDNFPVLIQHTDNDLRHTSFSGDVENINGYDIVFTSADGTTVLDHQIENYNSNTGNISFWVRIPLLSGTSNTEIYMYYGNSAIVANPSTTDVWDANHAAVYHFESIVNMGNDASTNGVNLTNNGVDNFSGIAYNDANFEVGDNLQGVSNPSVDISGDLTITCWLKSHYLQPGAKENVLASYGGTGFSFVDNYQYFFSVDDDWKLRVFWESGLTLTDINNVSTVAATPSPSTWTQLSVTKQTSSNKIRFYQDGVEIGASVDYLLEATHGSAGFLKIGQDQNDLSKDLDSEMDEMRISNVRRSEDWIMTEYNSISDPTTFYTLGNESPTSNALSYSNSTFCITETNPPPSIQGLSNGTFNSTTGLSINPTSGLIDLSVTTPATYTVTYTSPNNCINTYGLTINPGPSIACRTNDTVMADASCNYTIGDYTTDILNTVIDGCVSGSMSVTQNPLPGSVLPTGTHSIELTAEDGNGDTDICYFDLIIKSNLNPTIINCGDDLIGETTISNGNSTNNFSCSSFPTPGEDKFYQIDVPIGNYQLIMSLDNVSDNNTYTELYWIGSSCPTAGNCIEQKQYNNLTQSFQGGGNFVNFFAAGPGTYFLAIDSQGDGVTEYDLSFDCISSGIKLDGTGCTNDSNNDGVVNKINGNISNNLTHCQSATFCQDIYIGNDDNAEWLDSVSIKLDSCYINVSNFTTPHSTGMYEPGNWVSTYSGVNNQISWQFNNTNVSTWGDGYGSSYNCLGASPHLYTFCFDAEISPTCPSNNDLDIAVYVSDDGIGLGINDVAGADETEIAFTLNSIATPTISYTSTIFCPSGTASPTVSPTGGIFSSTTGLSINSTSGVIDLSASTYGTYVITYYEPNNCKFNTYSLTVGDNTPPTMICQDITVYLDAAGNATITAGDLDNGSTDNCGAVTLSASKTAFTCADTGTNTVTLTGTDAAFNTTNCPSTVTILDTISPVPDVASLPNLTNECSLTAVAPTATDNCGGTITATTSDPVVFNTQGTFSITWTYTDASSNSTTQSQSVIIDDISAPTISCGGNITENPSASCNFTLLDYTSNTATLSDNCGGTPTVTQSPAAGTVVTTNTTITLTADDGNGNTATCTFDVLLVDNTPPTMICQDITVYLDAAGNATITAGDLDNGSTDNCGAVTLSASKTAFTCADTGTNTVTLTGTDAAFNTTNCPSTVTILDTISPVITCNSDLQSCDSVYIFNISATDNCTGFTINQITGLASGSVFPLGITINTFEVIDASNNKDTCFFTVDRLPLVNANWAVLTPESCSNSATIDLNTLVDGTVGGQFSGPGVSANIFDPSLAGPGTHIINYHTENVSCSADSNQSIIIYDINLISAGSDESICDSVYSMSGTNILFGEWSSMSGNVTFDDNTDIFATASSINYGAESLVWNITSPATCSFSDTVIIIFDEQPIANAGNDTIIYEDFETNLYAIPSVGTGYWQIEDGTGLIANSNNPNSLFTSEEPGVNDLVWIEENASCPISEDEISVTFVYLLIPEGISPNSDGKNDFFEIIGLEQFGQVSVIIFDRWGKLVYENQDYDNSWQGQHINGSILIDDTYFYNVKIDNHTFNGFVMLKN